MKKLLVIMILFFGLVLTACDLTKTKTTTTKQSTTTTSTTGITTTTEQGPIVDECGKAEAKDNWVPVWCDEFDYEGLPHPSKWTLENKGDGFGNNELQFYTRRLDNAKVENGELTITVKKENYSNRNYTSAKLMSRGKGDFLYGKMEIRAKLPMGKGTWPAIWMMPTDSVYGGWPNSGEIDIMEHVGYDQNRIHGTVHTGNYNHNKGTQKGNSTKAQDVYNTYHVYAIEWDAKSIKWFVDGVKYHEFKNDEATNPDNSSGNWPFDQKFYLILNVAFGGNWGGAQGIDPNFSSSRMIVDYVRVYQKDYASLDKENPGDVEGFNVINNIPTSTKIAWNEASDDAGISHYEVYLNDEYINKTAATSFTFTDLTENTEYELKVIAVDYTGKKSGDSAYSFTTGTYPSVLSRIKAASYIDMQGIQLEATRDSDGGQNVGYIDPNDYLIYKLNVPEDGTYKVKFRIASTKSGNKLELINATDEQEVLLTEVTFGNTNGWQNWQTVEGSGSFNLTTGNIIIKVKASTDGFNINWFEFIKE